VWVFGKLTVGGGGDVDAGAGGNIVQDDWQVGGVRDGVEVADQAGLGGRVVVGGDVQQRVSARLFGLLGQPDGIGGVVAARGGDDRYPAGGALHGVGDAVHMFLVGHGGAFTGGAADDDGVGTVFDLVVDQAAQLLKVDRFVRIHRGHNRHTG